MAVPSRSPLPRVLAALVAASLAALALHAEPRRSQEPAAAAPSGPVRRLALVGGRVHTEVPGEAPRAADVWIDGERITALVEPGTPHPGYEALDVHGRDLVPGLIDALVYFDPEHDPLYLRAGVTLVRDVGGGRLRVLAERQRRDVGPGPRLLAAGAPLDGDPPGSPEAAILRDVASAEALLPIALADEPDLLAVLSNIPVDVLALVCERGHAAGLRVWGPIPKALSLEQALAAGQDGVLFLDTLLAPGESWRGVDDARAQAMAAALAASKAAVVPALEASVVRLSDPSADPAGLALLALLAPSYAEWWRSEAAARVPGLTPEIVAQSKSAYAHTLVAFRALHAAGVPLVPGAASPNPWLFPGNALHAELARWVEAGLAPADVLAAATYGAALALGQEAECGSLAPGRLADVLVVAGDPTADLAVLRDPELVVLRGRPLPRAELEGEVERLLERQNAARSLAAAPLPVEPPPLPEGRVVLQGLVESRGVGQRLSAERFAVVQLVAGGTAYLGHIVYAPEGDGVARSVLVRQDVVDGRMSSFRVIATAGDSEIVVDGIWAAESWRMQTTVNGLGGNGVVTTRERALALDVGSVTSLFLLARRTDEAPFPVITFHEAFTPEVVNWALAINPDGDTQIQTPLGPMAFRLGPEGAPERWRRLVGRGFVDADLLEKDAGGGAGHPLPVEVQRWRAGRAAEAAARKAAKRAGAEASPAGDEGGAEDGPKDGGADGDGGR